MKSSTKNKGSIIRAFGVVSSMTFLSRVTGYLRDAIIAGFLGASFHSDAFFVAFRIPNMFRRLLGEGALTPAIVPVVTELENRPTAERNAGIRSIVTSAALALAVLSVLGIVFSPFLVRLMAYGFAANTALFEMTVSLNRLMFPYLFFICMVAVYMGVLNARHHFFAPAFSPVLLNLSMIFALLVLRFWSGLPVYALAWGVLIGGAAQLVFQIPYLRKEGVPFMPGGPVVTAETRAVISMLLPSVFGLAVTQINVLVNTLVASFLQEGTVSHLYYADRLLELPIGLFTISFATAILPTVSRCAAENDRDGVRRNFARPFVYCMFFVLPAMFFLASLGRPVLSVLFARKAFDAAALDGSYAALLGYAWGLPFFSFNRLITPVFYAYRQTKDPVKAGFAAMVVNIAMNLLLMRFGAFGLASATSCAAVVNGWMLHRLFVCGHFDLQLGAAFASTARILAAAACAGVAGYFIAGSFPDDGGFMLRAGHLGLSISLFCAVYAASLFAFRVREAKEAWEIFKNKIKK